MNPPTTQALEEHESSAFPVLTLTPDTLIPKGSFAHNQARFLNPEQIVINRLDEALSKNNVGIVAHFYMDAELQGVLTSCQSKNIFIADSLMMASKAVEMAQGGIEQIVVLGVDFMSENVRATLDAEGYEHVGVYRVSQEPIGCSLAESAEADAYKTYLEEAAKCPHSLHVIYINTSLQIKAFAQTLVPTITCTSSNVVSLILQAWAQRPETHIWFGPDTYMGQNLAHYFDQLSQLSDEMIASIHPGHTKQTLNTAKKHFHFFKQGTCIVHHMFGTSVVETIKAHYPKAFVTAHFEVPGDMFSLGLTAQRSGQGVVGSTSQILGFIKNKVTQSNANQNQPLQFILGTESGMVTSITREVQALLKQRQQQGQHVPNVDILFPVAEDAVAQTQQTDLPIVPGVTAGEGCSIEGGCATCPYMKMNSLHALFDLLERLSSSKGKISNYAPQSYEQQMSDQGQASSVAKLGALSIQFMRSYQQHQVLPEALMKKIETHL